MSKARHYKKKKTTLYRERCEVKRAVFQAVIAGIDSNNLVYIDESGIDRYVYRKWGRARRGEKVMAEVSGKRFARESFIAGRCGKKTLAPLCFQGTCDSKLFNIWIKDFLLPELKPGQVVIMDNAAFHKSATTKELIEGADCHLLFLPPYSPDLNPIETFWANLKEKIRSIIHQFKTLQDAIDFAFNSYCFQG